MFVLMVRKDNSVPAWKVPSLCVMISSCKHQCCMVYSRARVKARLLVPSSSVLLLGPIPLLPLRVPLPVIEGGFIQQIPQGGQRVCGPADRVRQDQKESNTSSQGAVHCLHAKPVTSSLCYGLCQSLQACTIAQAQPKMRTANTTGCTVSLPRKLFCWSSSPNPD